MLRRIERGGVSIDAQVTLDVEGEEVTVPAGTTVAAALLQSGLLEFRDTPVGEVPRGPYCMMGVCFDCLVEIDGVPNRQACMTIAADGMRVRRQKGAALLDPADGGGEP
jgi:predicted molibdopterin-dependent oxidoreductase YjgC